MVKSRNSNVEFLRILSMLIIMWTHPPRFGARQPAMAIVHRPFRVRRVAVSAYRRD